MTGLECTRCGATHSPATLINLCTCGGILYPRYDLAGLRGKYDRNEVKDGPGTLWRYRRVLPVRDEANVISLGEGFTPIFPARRRIDRPRPWTSGFGSLIAATMREMPLRARRSVQGGVFFGWGEQGSSVV